MIDYRRVSYTATTMPQSQKKGNRNKNGAFALGIGRGHLVSRNSASILNNLE